MSKKSESIELRLPHETKQAFMARCRDRGVTASAELRGFIDAAVGGGRPARRPRLGFALPMGVLIGAALEAAIASSAFAHADVANLSAARAAVVRDAFDRIDANHDGVITRDEYNRYAAKAR
jgi:hypothetical protein